MEKCYQYYKFDCYYHDKKKEYVIVAWYKLPVFKEIINVPEVFTFKDVKKWRDYQDYLAKNRTPKFSGPKRMLENI